MIRLRAVVLVLVPLMAVAGCGGGDRENTSVTCSYPSSGAAARNVDTPAKHPPLNEPTTMTIRTSAGDIPVTLDVGKAPCTVNSFVSLAKQGYFDGVKCHRLLASGTSSVLQCGDPTGTSRGGPGYKFADELIENDSRLRDCAAGQCTYPAGTLAMANSGSDSNGSQFFLVYGDSVFPPAYTVFGEMEPAGLSTVKAVGAAGVDPSAPGAPFEGPPATLVRITSVK